MPVTKNRGMKRSNYLRNAIAGLIMLSAGFAMCSESSATSPPCSVTIPTDACSKDSNGNPIYGIQFALTHTLCNTNTLTITSSFGTVQPSTLSNVTSGTTYSFALFNPTSNPVFTFHLTGCGVSCNATAQLQSLPTNCGLCTFLQQPSVSACTGIVNGLCQYPFNVVVTNSTGVAGVVTLSSSVGTVSPQTYNANLSANTISGTLSVPCGTTSVTLTGALTLGGATAPQTCKATLNMNLPAPCSQTTQCAATFPAVTCVKDANGNPIYNITSNVTNTLGCPATLAITSSSGAVQPSSFSNISSPASVSFSLFGATTNPNLTFTWSGCGKTCTTTAQLPAPLPTNCGSCLVFGVPNVSACTGINGTLCQYPITINVTDNTNDPGVLTISPNVGNITPATFNLNPGVNTISGILSVPCGTNPVTLSVVLTIQGNPALPPQTCKATIAVKVPPPCVCSVTAASNQTICKGQETQVSVPQNTPGTVMWYYANAPCPPPGVLAPNPPWAPLCGGTTADTLSLDQSTCYEAVVTNMPNCPNPVVSNPVTVTVVDPCSGSIQCLVGSSPCPADGKLCSGSVVNLTFVNSGTCGLQWQQWIGSAWQNIPNATGTTLPSQTLTSPPSACPYTVYKFRVVCSCAPCPTAYPQISFNVYSPTAAGLVATNPTICEGDDDVVKLKGKCGDVKLWESSTTGPTSGFSTISGAGSATTWWTNKLYQDTWYRVTVQNGPCPSVIAGPVKITVNKKPTPTISAVGPTTVCAPNGVPLTVTNSAGGTCQWFYNGLPFSFTGTATMSGNYYVVCKNGCGIGKQSNVINVKISKVVAVIEGACGVCPPGCVQLGVVPGGGVPPYTFVWSPGGATSQTINACPTTNTTYTVTVTDSVGCTTTATHTVTICPKPLVAKAGKNQTIHLGGTVALGWSPTASGGTPPYTYSWSPAAGLNSTTIANPTASPGQTTTYTVTVTDANGCQSTSTVTVTVN